MNREGHSRVVAMALELLDMRVWRSHDNPNREGDCAMRWMADALGVVEGISIKSLMGVEEWDEWRRTVEMPLGMFCALHRGGMSASWYDGGVEICDGWDRWIRECPRMELSIKEWEGLRDSGLLTPDRAGKLESAYGMEHGDLRVFGCGEG